MAAAFPSRGMPIPFETLAKTLDTDVHEPGFLSGTVPGLNFDSCSWGNAVEVGACGDGITMDEDLGTCASWNGCDDAFSGGVLPLTPDVAGFDMDLSLLLAESSGPSMAFHPEVPESYSDNFSGSWQGGWDPMQGSSMDDDSAHGDFTHNSPPPLPTHPQSSSANSRTELEMLIADSRESAAIDLDTDTAFLPNTSGEVAKYGRAHGQFDVSTRAHEDEKVCERTANRRREAEEWTMISLDNYAGWNDCQAKNAEKRNNAVEKYLSYVSSASGTSGRKAVRKPVKYSGARIVRLVSNDEAALIVWRFKDSTRHIVAVVEPVFAPKLTKPRWCVAGQFECDGDDVAETVLTSVYEEICEQKGSVGGEWTEFTGEEAYQRVRSVTECFYYFKGLVSAIGSAISTSTAKLEASPLNSSCRPLPLCKSQ
eukprot:m.430981 g.430981  ORF g.430981 m.430981 type:complete len:425 (-) comp17239_c0_seq1:26-1300(-)